MNAQKQTYSLSSKKREIFGKKVKNLRHRGLIPGIVYGHDTKGESVSVEAALFSKIFKEAGSSALVDLTIDDKNAFKVLIKEPQCNPVTGQPIHADFYKVKMDEKIKTEIPLEFVGESDAVANLDGSLVTNRDMVEVECLPSDLVGQIEVDISVLKTFEDQITISNIKLPSGIEILSDPEEVICFVEEPRSEEEMAELEESAADQEKEAIEQMGAEAAAEGAEGEEGEDGKSTESEPDKPKE